METLQLNEWLDRWRAGDMQAREDLLRAAYPRLELLARKMVGGFPNVRPLYDTQDVLQNAVVRLLRSLRQVNPPPASTREFFRLAAVEIRRELLDMARECGAARRRGEVNPKDSVGEPMDERDSPEDLERWTAFHEAVECLPDEEREVVGLLFYHGRTQAAAAELLGVGLRTVARRWHSACHRLDRMLDGNLPRE